MLLSRAIRNEANSPNSNDERTWQQIFLDLITGASGNTPETADRLGAVSAAHRIITNSLAYIPWQIRQNMGSQRLEVHGHILSAPLKRRANPYMTAFTAQKTMISYAFWHGVGYSWIKRDYRKKTVEIIPLVFEPTISYDSDGYKWYTFTLPQETPYGGLTKTFGERDLLIYRFESYDGNAGRGLLDMAKDAISTDLKAQEYGNKFYSNGARLSGILEVEGELSDDKRERLKQEFNAKYSGENAYSVAVLDLGMKYNQLGISQQESQYAESREFSVDEVARFTGVPLYMLQSGKQSYQSNEQQQLDFVMNTLVPHVTQLEQEYTYKLFDSEDLANGFYLHKNINALMRGTHEARAKFYTEMMSISAMNADEVRANEDESPLPNGLGQTYWMSKNYAPVEDKDAFNANGKGGESK